MKIDHKVIGFGEDGRGAAVAAGRGHGVRAFGIAMIGARLTDIPMPLFEPKAA